MTHMNLLTKHVCYYLAGGKIWFLLFVLSCFSCVRLFVTSWTIAHQAPLSMELSKNTGVGCHSLLHGMFPTQELNPSLLPCKQNLYYLNHQRYVYQVLKKTKNTQIRSWPGSWWVWEEKQLRGGAVQCEIFSISFRYRYTPWKPATTSHRLKLYLRKWGEDCT